MPLATALWLVDNTSLSFKQIANFTQLDELEINAIADGELAANITPQNPIIGGQVLAQNIIECENDPKKELLILEDELFNSIAKVKKGRYVPIAKRRDKPDAIAWIIKNHPEITDAKIVKLIGTTKNTIEAIRNRTHKNISEIQPKDPVFLGLCQQSDIDELK